MSSKKTTIGEMPDFETEFQPKFNAEFEKEITKISSQESQNIAKTTIKLTDGLLKESGQTEMNFREKMITSAIIAAVMKQVTAVALGSDDEFIQKISDKVMEDLND